MENMEKVENLARALMEAMQDVGGKVSLLSSVLIGETTQFDNTTTIDKLIKALKDHTEEMHMQNELMKRYMQVMQEHTRALSENTAMMSRHANAMVDHDQGMRSHANSMYR